MNSSEGTITPDAKELILCEDERYVCDTYIFEPAPDEARLGYLFGVGEIEDRGGVGRELLDLIINAIQKEYYRDLSRGPAQSFELALHQANLILHDSTEQGIKDWMGYFHVAVCVLAGSSLHISVAGEASVTLARKSLVTDISEGLATFPVTNPLRTFSQVASGSVSSRDMLFLGTAGFGEMFSEADLSRFALEASAATVSTRLQQLYQDRKESTPLSALTVALLPEYVAAPAPQASAMPENRRRGEAVHSDSLKPRQPLILQRSWLKTMFLSFGRLLKLVWTTLASKIWPFVVKGSRQGGAAIYNASKATGQKLRNRGGVSDDTGDSMSSKPSRKISMGDIPALIVAFPMLLWQWLKTLPTSSKIFAGVTGVFAVALIVSLLLLQTKRAADADIQRASELLQSAQTKKDAAATALIYDNRDQAVTLLSEAESLSDEVASMGLYAEEVAQVQAEIDKQNDRLQKITRFEATEVDIVGDFGGAITETGSLRLFLIDEVLYTYNPQNNAVLKMDLSGSADQVTQTTQGVGFFTGGSAHAADKTILLSTDSPGVALFDASAGTIHKQDIALPESARIASLSVFGSRLYAFDDESNQVLVFNKTLRGYSGGEAWITDDEFSKDSIESIAVDGNIFTLHQDGSVKRLFKGVEAEYGLGPITPSLASAERIYASEELQYIYVVDPSNKRVVILTKDGQLVSQAYVEAAADLQDIAISADEETMYALDGTRVLSMSLLDETTEE